LSEDAQLVVALFSYVLAGRLVLSRPDGAWRDGAFAAVNLAAVAAVSYVALGPYAWFFGVYLALAILQWALTRALALRPGRLPWLAVCAPIAALVVVRYLPFAFRPLWSALGTPPAQQIPARYFVGISYMAFRLSYLVLEVRNGLVKSPGLGRYLSFAFFFPTMQVGPINRYSEHDRSLSSPDPAALPPGRCLLRVLVGLAKYLFLGNLASQLSYAGLVGDFRQHPRIDWPIAAVGYYVYLYLNFSGFCDVAVGTAGLVGVHVEENFNSPFAARNVRDFWNRWHITLSVYMRDMVFTPLSKWLVGSLGPKRRDHAVALAVFTVFLLVGIWHGAGLNYAAFGLIHAVAVVAHHYYGLWLRRRLGKDGLRAYGENRLVRAICVALTFTYVAASLGVFAMKGDAILRVLHLTSGSGPLFPRASGPR
jgi:D-alanyl-lipoteichoic acid acyltransferase DltB (MBOAT superfamily)